jgi:hypothetical protein
LPASVANGSLLFASAANQLANTTLLYNDSTASLTFNGGGGISALQNGSNGGGFLRMDATSARVGGSANLTAGGSIDLHGTSGATGGSLSASANGTWAGGSLNLSANSSAAGGAISTVGGGAISTAGGGTINTSNGGGIINTSNGGGSIDTYNGTVGLGPSGTRVTLQTGTITAPRTLTIPDVTGTLYVQPASPTWGTGNVFISDSGGNFTASSNLSYNVTNGNLYIGAQPGAGAQGYIRLAANGTNSAGYWSAVGSASGNGGSVQL